MAEKKSKKNTSPRQGNRKNGKASAAERAVDAQMDGALLSTRAICALVVLVLFLLHAVIAINPDGALLKVLYKFLLGTIGQAAFYISIPALLGLFCILTFNRKRPVVMKSICLIVFVFVMGSISQLTMGHDYTSRGFALIGELYRGGAMGTTAGVICGGFALSLYWFFGIVFSYIILILTALALILSVFDLTIPSLIRAFHNRPRPEPEEEPEEEYQEPAELVVNSIVIKQQEWAQRRREREEEARLQAAQEPPRQKKEAKRHAWADAFMRAVDKDIDGPVGTGAEETEPVQQPSIQEQSRGQELPLVQEQPPVPERPCLQEQSYVIVEEPEEELPPVRNRTEENRQPEHAAEVIAAPAATAVISAAPASAVAEPAAPSAHPEAAPSQKVTAKEAAQSAAEVAEEIAKSEAVEKPEYCYPPIELLHLPAGGKSDGTDEMRENSRRLNETLASFKIEAHIINVTRGPSVTRYEVELDRGVRLNKLTTSADDIALNLGASGVRIAAVPGKISVVGIEVPNKSVTTVSLREVIGSPEFTKAKSKSSFAVGKDIGGNCIIGNIAKLPHMLIAGTTGSGKSVCMNSIIISLLYKASPDDVKLIMVDPKMVELGIYNGIPHLLIPVVTDPKKAAGSLQWAVTEMMRRYRAMSDAGVRDLESYNAIVDSEEGGKHLPQVVVIIDELADLMLVAAKEVEESICRIAQMGRAAGIHLIIATQRPSADVITGLMKANIPSRIAFAVASAMESRIILDTQGAEKLVGKGDMLYAPIGCGKPKRVQGSWVSESEVEAVAAYIKEHYQTDYDESVMEEIDKKAEQTGSKSSGSDPQPTAEEMEGDEMLPAAVDVILETGQASVSMLQRRLKLGYARAARIVDEMEEKGIVGPFMGSKPRNILITKEQWQVMRSGGTPEPEQEPEILPEEEMPPLEETDFE